MYSAVETCAPIMSPYGVPRPAVVLPVTTNPGQEFTPSLSPDGKLLAYSWSNAPDTIGIWVRQADVGTPICLTSAKGRNGSAAWSPDGRWFAFARRAAAADASGLFVIPALGGTERRLVAAAEIGDLEWMPDGKAIVFTMRRSPTAPYDHDNAAIIATAGPMCTRHR